MKELIWLNGEVMALSDAKVGVEDRGFQFADGVYEVVRVYRGKAFTLAEHLERLERSCAGISMSMPMSKELLAGHIQKLIGASELNEGMVYLQITRGCSERNHVFPACKSTVLFYTRALPAIPAPGKATGVKLLSVADERWERCWIKSVALLANVLAKNAAISAGCDEAVFVKEGMISECSASNIFIVSRGELVTHPVGNKVLPGVTRRVLLGLAKQVDVPVVERPFSEAEAIAADEVFITSTTRELSWVSQWNGRTIARQCGPVTLKLHEAFAAHVAGSIA